VADFAFAAQIEAMDGRFHPEPQARELSEVSIASTDAPPTRVHTICATGSGYLERRQYSRAGRGLQRLRCGTLIAWAMPGIFSTRIPPLP
jgi:hypothetical protein